MAYPIGEWTNAVHQGDCLGVLEELPADSVHAIVTDPPYGLAFMGRSWDDFEPKEYQEWCERWARKAQRVLKPGGHLLAFSGNRTHHRLFSGVEDAGFEIRDTLTWHYGSGFPKALDVSQAIDKAAGADREVVGTREYAGGHVQNSNELDRPIGTLKMTDGDERKETEPATDAAERWDGWKTGLKPATEFVVLARSPLAEGTVAENVQTHGTGALNIDGTRIESDSDLSRLSNGFGTNEDIYGEGDLNGEINDAQEGRYPANVVFDAIEAERLDREVGKLTSGARPAGEYGAASGETYGEYSDQQNNERIEYSEGGPSRYFYTSKAEKAERTLNGRIDNAHPTVKPQDLMEWLVRLVTREGQIVLDPFAGTGTTLSAAKELGREFVGIEKQAQWADVARVRAGLTPEDPSHVRADENQQGLEAYTDGGTKS